MGVPAVPLGQLYGSEAWKKIGQVEIHPRSPVDQVRIENGKVLSVRVGGNDVKADAYVSALPFERAGAMLPELNLDLSSFEHSPITGIHSVVRSPDHRSAARHSARSDHPVDVQ